MISAKEAKELYNQSEVRVDEFLKNKVEHVIINAAKSGKQHVFIFLDNVNIFESVEQKLTPLDRAVVEKLKQLGYRAGFQRSGDSYIPPGLADDDGDGPLHINYGIMIGW